jgi:hypothetical protein
MVPSLGSVASVHLTADAGLAADARFGVGLRQWTTGTLRAVAAVNVGRVGGAPSSAAAGSSGSSSESEPNRAAVFRKWLSGSRWLADPARRTYTAGMKIVVLGASQGTGALCVKAALAAGHAVTVFARTPSKLGEPSRAFLIASVVVMTALSGCGVGDWSNGVTTRGSALLQVLSPSADTFVNSAVPDNNNGASPSIYTGENGQTGVMRGLVRFTMPAQLRGRLTVSRVALTMITRGTGVGDTTAPTAAMESLDAITVAWQEGLGFGDAITANTVGQACGTSGATWNQPDCAGGVPWSGGSVSPASSGTAAVPASLETAVTWDSDQPGNAGMIADVQSWLDSPDTNQGWRLASSTEGMNGKAQRFYSREVLGKGPSLSVTAVCISGLQELDGGCSTVKDSDAGDATDAGDASSSDARPAATESGGGCSCSVSGRNQGRWLLDASLALAVLMIARRTRRLGTRSAGYLLEIHASAHAFPSADPHRARKHAFRERLRSLQHEGTRSEDPRRGQRT